MKNLLTAIIIFIGICSFNCQQKEQKPGKVSFVGYYFEQPVFYSVTQNCLYLLNEESDSLTFLFEISADEQLLDVNNSFVLNNKKSRKLYITDKDKRLLRDNIGEECKKNLIAFRKNISFSKRTDSISLQDSNGTKVTGLKGEGVYLNKDFLYFGKQNVNEIGPDVTLYRASLSDFSKVEKLAENLACVFTIVLNDNSKVIDERLLRGGFKYVVYNIEKRELKEIPISDKYYGENYTAFYSYAKKRFCIMNRETFEKFFFAID